MNNRLDYFKETVESFQDDVSTLGKFVFNKLSPKKIRENKEHLEETLNIIETLSEEQQTLFLDLIAYSERNGGIDFNVPQIIEKTRPEEKDKLFKIFQGMALEKTPTNRIKKQLELKQERDRTNSEQKEIEITANKIKKEKIEELKGKL